MKKPINVGVETRQHKCSDSNLSTAVVFSGAAGAGAWLSILEEILPNLSRVAAQRVSTTCPYSFFCNQEA